MTEGAKTGTAITDAAKFDCQPGNPMVPGGSWVVPLAIAEQLERDKTEALKVAGEAVEPITMQDVRLRAGEGTLSARDVLFAVNAILKRRGDALERIRNKG